MDVKVTISSSRTRTYTVTAATSTEDALAKCDLQVTDSEPVITGSGVAIVADNQSDTKNMTTQVV